MREDVIPQSDRGHTDHLVEECSELIVEAGSLIKALCKLNRFGNVVPDSMTGITYDNTAYVVSAIIRLRSEINDVNAAIERVTNTL